MYTAMHWQVTSGSSGSDSADVTRMTDGIDEGLRRIEAKLDQCIAINNENHMLCNRILQRLDAIVRTEPEADGPAAEEAAILKARKDKAAAMAAIVSLSSRREALRNRLHQAGDDEKADIRTDLDRLEAEISAMQNRLERIISDRQL